MFSKQNIIEGMCLTYRHDYGMLPIQTQMPIKTIMTQLYEHNIIPLLQDLYDDISCDCEQCRAVVPKTILKAIGEINGRQ